MLVQKYECMYTECMYGAPGHCVYHEARVVPYVCGFCLLCFAMYLVCIKDKSPNLHLVFLDIKEFGIV